MKFSASYTQSRFGRCKLPDLLSNSEQVENRRHPTLEVELGLELEKQKSPTDATLTNGYILFSG